MPLSREALVTVVVSVALSAVSGGVVKRSDDVPALQKVVEQQALTIQSLEARLTAVTQSLSALQQSQATLTNRLQAVETEIQDSHHTQAAFHVKFAGSYNTPLDVGTHAVLKFNSIVTNVGDGFNPNTGIFTAPYAGSYLFFLEATHIPDTTHSTQLGIYKTGHQGLAFTYGDPASRQTDDGYTSDTAQAATHLKAGEQVWVEHTWGGTLFRQSSFTTFTGALVQAD